MGITDKKLDEMAKNGFVLSNSMDLKRYTGDGGDIIIPNGVTGICAEVFKGREDITSVKLPVSLYEIGEYAFNGCTALKSINLSNVRGIGMSAFSGCTALEEIDISKIERKLEYFCFRDCSALKKVIMPKKLDIIYNSAFENCTSLEEICIPKGVTTLNHNVFRSCASLKALEIKNTVWDIEGYAFAECTSLKKVIIRKLFRSISCAFNECKSLETLIVEGSSGYLLKSWSFDACTSLRNVYLDRKLYKLDAYTFIGCTALHEIYYEGSEEEWNDVMERSETKTERLGENIKIHFNATRRNTPFYE